MSLQLGSLVFDEETTTVQERYDEVGGRDAREIVVSGLIADESDVEALESRLDVVLQAAADVQFSAALQIRENRVLYVRRKAFSREIQRETCVGSFVLTLEARDPFEWAAAETILAWTIDADPDAFLINSEGTAEALPILSLTPAAEVANPAIGDGTRTLRYQGVVAAGQTLVMDAETARVTLDGEDVTPYTDGEFPRIPPPAATLTYSDTTAAAPAIAAEVRFRDRWW